MKIHLAIDNKIACNLMNTFYTKPKITTKAKDITCQRCIDLIYRRAKLLK